MTLTKVSGEAIKDLDFGSENIATTGKIGVGAGSAGAPSINFTSDTNTGIYSPGADEVAISTNGTQRLLIDSSGNVNIDSNTLYVDATNNRVGLGSNSPAVAFEIAAATPAVRVSLASDSTKYGTFYSSAGTTAINARNGASNGSIIFQRSDGTTTTTSATIDSSGRLGIGTSPGEKFDVATASGNCYSRFSNGTVTFYGGVSDGLTAGLIGTTSNHPLSIYANGNERARIDTSGRLLVGTSSSSRQTRVSVTGNTGGASNEHGIIDLQFSGTAPGTGFALGYLNFADTSTGNAARIGAERDTGTWTSGSSMPGRLVFFTTADGASSPTERMRITQSGIVYAGTTTADGEAHHFERNAPGSYAFRVTNSNTNNSVPTNGIKIVYPSVTPNDVNAFLACVDSTNNKATIRNNGGIANYTANDVNLSDRNVKKDIAPAAGTWDCLKEWEIVNFRYKDQPADADLNVGVIAQQVAESCPEVITVFQQAKEATETEPAQAERLGVKEQQMMWMAIKALQEAQLRIETLEAEVAALKGA